MEAVLNSYFGRPRKIHASRGDPGPDARIMSTG